jgi:integrase/recombinase XerC
VIRGFGRESGVTLSSHRLRHTCLTRLVRAGVDIVTVAEIAGHSRIETTRRYSLPTADVMIAAVEKLNYATSPQ